MIQMKNQIKIKIQKKNKKLIMKIEFKILQLKQIVQPKLSLTAITAKRMTTLTI